MFNAKRFTKNLLLIFGKAGFLGQRFFPQANCGAGLQDLGFATLATFLPRILLRYRFKVIARQG